MKIGEIPPAELETLVEDLADLQHDLGRYITFEVRFLDSKPDTEALRAALTADLLHTRRHGDAVEDCQAIWGRLRPTRLEGDPDLLALDLAMEALRSADLAGDRPDLDRTAALANSVAQLTRSLLKRARALTPED